MELDHPGHEALERRGGRILGSDHHEVHDHEHQHHDDQRVDGRSGTRGRPPPAAQRSPVRKRRNDQGPQRQRHGVERREARDRQERPEHQNAGEHPQPRCERGQPLCMRPWLRRGRPPQERDCPDSPEQHHPEQSRLASSAPDHGRQAHGEDPQRPASRRAAPPRMGGHSHWALLRFGPPAWAPRRVQPAGSGRRRAHTAPSRHPAAGSCRASRLAPARPLP